MKYYLKVSKGKLLEFGGPEKRFSHDGNKY